MNKKNAAIQLSLVVMMTTLVAVSTLTLRIPNPMGGYFNLGDVLIFVTALTFGPIVGGIAGGVGSAIADVIGFPLFAIPTLLIKGLEGLIAGIINDNETIYRDIFAIIFAGIEMVAGYFLVEWVILQWNFTLALAEVPANVIQVAIGGVVGIPIAYLLRKRLPEYFNR